MLSLYIHRQILNDECIAHSPEVATPELSYIRHHNFSFQCLHAASMYSYHYAAIATHKKNTKSYKINFYQLCKSYLLKLALFIL